jgi:hypothetical protein
MENKETITITMQRYEELLKAYLVCNFKKKELEGAGYVSEFDRLLFEIGMKNLEPAPAEDDF